MNQPGLTLRVPGEFIAAVHVKITVTREFRFRIWLARQFIELACLALGTTAIVSAEIDSTPNLLDHTEEETNHGS